METSKVYQEGKQAKKSGFGFNANPYDPTVEPALFEAWLTGWGSEE